MFVTLSVLRDETGKEFFAVNDTRLGKYKTVGIAKFVSRQNVLISDLIKAIGIDEIKKAIEDDLTIDTLKSS